MTTGETLSPIEQAKSSIELAIRKNAEYYHELADSDAALTISDLSATERGAQLVRSDEFREMVTLIDWPDREDRAKMTWKMAFHDSPEADEIFADAYFAPTNPLNNAIDYMLAEAYTPETFPPSAQGIGFTQYLYGSAPFRMRAQLVTPELFQSLREFDQAVGHLNLRRYLKEHHEASEPVIHAMRVAYTVLGRCMRSEDNILHEKMMGHDGRQEVIRDISDTLQT